jgi:hypothetical protein
MRRLILATASLMLAAACSSGASSKANPATKASADRAAPVASTTPPEPAIDDRGFSKLDNGHQADENVFEQPMSSATRQVLAHQLLLAREAAMRYPTVADAEAAGWKRAGPFAPGLGAHYFHWSDIAVALNPDGTFDDSDASHPAALIYDGTKPTSRLAGLMYYSLDKRLPAGFAGPNDIWHYHNNVCTVYEADGTVDTPYGADTTVSQPMCDKVGGTLMRKTQYMLHAWVVPGYDSPQGVFSHLNEAITCRDGTYHTIPLDRIGNRTTVCVDGAE